MAQQNAISSVASLRAITYRISSTPTQQLPRVAAQIAASLWNCKDLLSTSQQTTKSRPETSALLHQFKTSLSALLQDRTIEGRWAAIVLVKATVEAGGIEVLSKSAAWVRNLLSILKKPDPPTTRNLAIITLTRMFMLTWDHSNLVREIATPNVPTFITSCLNGVENRQRCSTSELQTVLEAFAALIPRHPTIFRAHEGQIRSLLLRILSSTSSSTVSNIHYTEGNQNIAERLLVLLHHCAPKQGSAEKWNDLVKVTVSSAHDTCNHLFRSVIEDWRPTSGVQQATNAPHLSAGEMALEDQDSIGLSPWKGVFAGGERLIVLLGILRSHLDTVTPNAVTLPVGLIINLSTRLLTVTAPSSENTESMKVNAQFPKDERELMFSILPDVHAATLKLINSMLTRLGTSIISVMQELLQLVLRAHACESAYVHVRTAVYETSRQILEYIGPSMSKEDVADLAPVIRACCDDLLPNDAKQITAISNQTKGMASKRHLTNGDLSQSSTELISSRPTRLDDLWSEARSLLSIILIKTNPIHLPRKLRVQVERTAVLTRHREALISAVMNPARKHDGTATETSLLPLLAGLYPESNEVEAILRPRMPVISSKGEQVLEDLEASAEDEENVLSGVTEGELMDIQGGAGGRQNEPTEDLLSALQQNDTLQAIHGDMDNLYGASSRAPSESEGGQQKPGYGSDLDGSNEPPAKRTAVGPPEESVSAKRLRASPVAKALEPDFSRAPLQPGPLPIETSLPATVTVEESAVARGSSEHSFEVPTLPRHIAEDIPGERKFEQITGTGVNSHDDSDLEIPPLNMEPDTDSEDDEDDNEEG